jgi:hypothetical protein
MTESVGNNENLNDFGTIVIKTHFRLSALTELTGEFDVYHQRVIFVIEIFSYLMAETKDWEMSQICIVSVKFLKDVRDFDRNAANWQ